MDREQLLAYVAARSGSTVHWRHVKGEGWEQLYPTPERLEAQSDRELGEQVEQHRHHREESLVSDAFPFDEDLNNQHMHFDPRSPGPEAVSEHSALSAAVSPEWRVQDPPAAMEAWFGDICADHPLTSAHSRPAIPAGAMHPVWLVRISNMLTEKRGHRGSRATFTEQWVIVDGRSGKVLRRFSFR